MSGEEQRERLRFARQWRTGSPTTASTSNRALSANVGADYRLHGVPLTVGGNFSWVPPYSVQETDVQAQSYELTRVVDAYALWTIDKKTKLRLSLSNVVPRNYVTTNSIVAGGQAQTVVANGPDLSRRGVAVRDEVVGPRAASACFSPRGSPTTRCAACAAFVDRRSLVRRFVHAAFIFRSTPPPHRRVSVASALRSRRSISGAAGT